ncbi:hypothetical protein SGQ83_02025 [Flavobacterium sp. Fl-318]|uniref:Glutathionylspermidine synthase pre-ATP-grasp-like domain-containing protein n=1 Tax=Flavobacterium cupriresistens TaxID=2893885 RepID=A0ABU4R7A6_9FLAO|nr:MULTISPECIES: hypothetical protein [unclassified Flavobacterium]MDX6188111.1 hypothetical protein [Flavobacterium sp. Fl-318]UFH41968.1 hypothetical protein LNP23_19425 [Flavobacterium sp. F-323]
MIKNTTEEYTILSEKFLEFEGTKDIPARINTNHESVPDVFKSYKYPVSGWPVLINKQMTQELTALSVKIPSLLKQIPSLYFNDDIKKLAEFYFAGDEMMAEFAMLCHKKDLEIGCRLDLTFTEDGFKVLEANIGSSIGGWQIQSFESLIRNNHPELVNKDKVLDYKGRNTLQIYMKFLIEQIIKQLGKQSTINLFMEMGDIEDEAEKEESLGFFDKLFKEELANFGLNGGAYGGDMNELTLTNGNLCLGDKVIHSLIILTMDMNVTPAIFRAFMMDRIYLPDHLGLRMLGDKRNLFILLELAQAGKFSPEENELILKNIPWTSFIENKKVIFKDREHNLPDLLKTDKDKFVIKVARGFQGKDVFIGKFSTEKEWEEALELALQNNAFIAQEFSDSLDFLAPNAENEWTLHKLIWGSFGFGDCYGGVWVRMSEVKTDVGVINSATGAVEAIVFEIAN